MQITVEIRDSAAVDLATAAKEPSRALLEAFAARAFLKEHGV